MKPGMFLLNKASVTIADKWPVMLFSANFLSEENSAQIWALGSSYKFVHTHAMKAVANVTAVEMYEQGLEMTWHYVKVFVIQGRKQDSGKPPRAPFNKNNVVEMQQTLYQVGLIKYWTPHDGFIVDLFVFLM